MLVGVAGCWAVDAEVDEMECAERTVCRSRDGEEGGEEGARHHTPASWMNSSRRHA